MPEATDQDLESRRLIAELGRDIFRWPSLDEEGTEGFIATLKGSSRLEEEAPAGLVVHGVGSHQLTVFCRPRTPERTGSANRDKRAAGLPAPGFRRVRATFASRGGPDPADYGDADARLRGPENN